MRDVDEIKPSNKMEPLAYERALIRVGGMAKTPLKNLMDEVMLTQSGVQPSAVDDLAQTVITLQELSWVITRRTLLRRKERGENLTPEESGRWLRVAKLCALAIEVFGSNEKAASWLRKPRQSLHHQSAIALMQTEPGARLVEECLGQVYSGYFA